MNSLKLERARNLRRNMTKGEQFLWRVLRNNSVAGLHFRRQQVIGGFIVDFYCASARLAVEIDGPIHERQRHSDAARDRALAENGIRTLRIGCDAVERDLAAVISEIVAAAT